MVKGYNSGMNIVVETLLDNLPAKNKLTSSGWHNFNGVCCHHNGESRPDTKRRGNLMITPESGIVYNCYNCGFKTGWSPGSPIYNKVEKLFKWFGISSDEIGKIKLGIIALKKEDTSEFSRPNTDVFKKIDLPFSLNRIEDISEYETDTHFVEAIEYVCDRNPFLLNFVDFYWTPDTMYMNNKRLIMKADYNGETYGYIGRWAKKEKPAMAKYINQVPEGFIFNMDALFKKSRKYVILCEGPLDALCVDGISCLGNQVSPQQLKWLKQTDKQIVVVPDRDEAGKKLIKQAIDNGWWVSFPRWGDDVKDVEKATAVYGRLFTIEKIIDNIAKDEIMIEIKSKEWF